jgi:hypothetical protein
MKPEYPEKITDLSKLKNFIIVEPIADGKPETIPAKIIIEIPLPIPFSVICSPHNQKHKLNALLIYDA